MSVLNFSARRQVTLRKEVLQHLGIKPREKIELELLPDRMCSMKAARQTVSIDTLPNALADAIESSAMDITHNHLNTLLNK